MGIKNWFTRSTEPVSASRLRQGSEQPVKMSGTTTYGADAANRLFRAHSPHAVGPLELAGQLVAEPENPADPNAVAVHVQGERVGYVPGYLAGQLCLEAGEVLHCRVQLWGAEAGNALRVIGWVAHGTGPVAWPHSAQSPPALTAVAQLAERAASTTRMVDEALIGDDPARAEQFRRGMVGRYHYLETVEPIQQLKREGRPEEALELCYGAISAAEEDRGGREPAPWYTEQAAIIHRKRGERDEELAVLRRWLRLCPADRRGGSKIQQRLDKLVAKG